MDTIYVSATFKALNFCNDQYDEINDMKANIRRSFPTTAWLSFTKIVLCQS